MEINIDIYYRELHIWKNIINGGEERVLNETGWSDKRSENNKRDRRERGRGRVLGTVEYKRVQCRFEI